MKNLYLVILFVLAIIGLPKASWAGVPDEIQSVIAGCSAQCTSQCGASSSCYDDCVDGCVMLNIEMLE